jgi:hypothetical protein
MCGRYHHTNVARAANFSLFNLREETVMRSIYVLFAAAFVFAGCAKNDTDEAAMPPADTSTMPSTTTEPTPVPPAEETMPPSDTAPSTTDTPPAQTPPAQ